MICPLTEKERVNLEVGDRVVVVMDDGSQKEFDVKYEPWQLASGTWVVGLKGISGGYLLSRVLAKAGMR